MIDVQRLRILRAVAEHGSFNRAAGALLLTPSAVSQHIASLERTLGQPVAVRSTRGVTLTEPGRLLVEAAETISAELDQVRHEIDRLTAPRPRLTVATFTSGGRRPAARGAVPVRVRASGGGTDGAGERAGGRRADGPQPAPPTSRWPTTSTVRRRYGRTGAPRSTGSR